MDKAVVFPPGIVVGTSDRRNWPALSLPVPLRVVHGPEMLSSEYRMEETSRALLPSFDSKTVCRSGSVPVTTLEKETD